MGQGTDQGESLTRHLPVSILMMLLIAELHMFYNYVRLKKMYFSRKLVFTVANTEMPLKMAVMVTSCLNVL